MFRKLAGILSGARTRLALRLQEGEGLGSPEAYQREIRRLEAELEAVRAKRRREEAVFRDRHGIIREYPRAGGMSFEEVDRRLANLKRIRDDRLRAEELAYDRQIRELRRLVQDRFGPS